MTNKNCLFLPALAIALSGCSNTITPEADIKWVSPAGAPTLAFYDQGDNANFVTETTPTNVAAQLQKNEYDAVVFDSISGLKSVKAKNTNYVLAKLITGGNFYLVSIDKEEDAMPSECEVIVPF